MIAASGVQMFAVLGVSLLACTSGTSVTYSGYLVDIYCYDRVAAGGLALDGSNVVTDPASHTVHCMRDMPQCRTYYLAENIGTASSPNYQQKFILDDAGNQMALTLLNTTSLVDDFKVTVTGTHTGNGILSADNIVECSGASCDGECSGACTVAADVSYVSYSGYLVDIYCYDLVAAGGLALDNSNVVTDPASHTVHCMRDMPQCRTYYLAENIGTAASPNYQQKFILNDEGNQMALALLTETTRVDDFKVTVTGTHAGNGVLHVATVGECEGNSCDGECSGSCAVSLNVSYVEYSGYLVDIFCYDRVAAGGLALDNSDVVTDPASHTVHCMRDIPQCRTYYLAENIGTAASPNYQQKFILNDEGNQMALALLMETTRVDDFRVTVTGMHGGSGTLHLATISECDGAACDGECSGACTVSAGPEDPTSAVTSLASSVLRFRAAGMCWALTLAASIRARM